MPLLLKFGDAEMVSESGFVVDSIQRRVSSRTSVRNITGGVKVKALGSGLSTLSVSGTYYPLIRQRTRVAPTPSNNWLTPLLKWEAMKGKTDSLISGRVDFREAILETFTHTGRDFLRSAPTDIFRGVVPQRIEWSFRLMFISDDPIRVEA